MTLGHWWSRSACKKNRHKLLLTSPEDVWVVRHADRLLKTDRTEYLKIGRLTRLQGKGLVGRVRGQAPFAAPGNGRKRKWLWDADSGPCGSQSRRLEIPQRHLRKVRTGRDNTPRQTRGQLSRLGTGAVTAAAKTSSNTQTYTQ